MRSDQILISDQIFFAPRRSISRSDPGEPRRHPGAGESRASRESRESCDVKTAS